jgi:hypothetical protein
MIVCGRVEQVCEISRNIVLVSTSDFGCEFEVVEARNLWNSKKGLVDYLKTLRHVKPGDLVSYVHDEWSPGHIHEAKLAVGTCVKTTRKFAHIASDIGIKKVLRNMCIVIKRSDE